MVARTDFGSQLCHKLSTRVLPRADLACKRGTAAPTVLLQGKDLK